MKRKLPTIIYNTYCKRPKWITSLSNLPVEMLIEVFQKLSAPERRAIQTVNKHVFSVLNKYFSDDNCLVISGEYDFSPQGLLYRTFQSPLRQKRSFSHMIIKSLPLDREDALPISDFLELVGDEVQHLKIEENIRRHSVKSRNWIGELIYEIMPNLKCLEVSDDLLFDNVQLPASLTEIRMQKGHFRIDKVSSIRNMKTITCFRAANVVIFMGDLEKGWISSILEPQAIEAFKEVLNYNKDGFLSFESIFNFCGEKKLSTDDVIGIGVYTNALTFGHCHFKNLNYLRLHQLYGGTANSTVKSKPVGNSKLKSLKIAGEFQHSASSLDTFIQNFPDLESLKIARLSVDNELFAKICQFMPKLKRLSVMSERSVISLEAMLSESRYSLKDLPSLKKIEITTEEFEVNEVPNRWPSLPYLKELRLEGRCFQNQTEKFYLKIVENSPNITSFHLDFMEYWEIDVNPGIFFPIISKLQLKHLSLPGDYYITSNKKLISNIMHYCKNLKTLTLHGYYGPDFKQELELFAQIPSLEVINSEVMEPEYNIRQMTRKDYENPKEYLKTYVTSYKDQQELFEHLTDNYIPLKDQIQKLPEFNAKFPEEVDEVRKIYNITHNFLNLDEVQMCNLIYNCNSY